MVIEPSTMTLDDEQQHTSKQEDITQAQRSSGEQADHLDDFGGRRGQGNEGAATAAGADGSSMTGQQEGAQPSVPATDESQPDDDLQVAEPDAAAGIRRDSDQRVNADVDVHASRAECNGASDEPPLPSTSLSPSPLNDALDAAGKSIFDAYHDLVAYVSSSDGQPDELLLSALGNVETAMRNIVVAQQEALEAAGQSIFHAYHDLVAHWDSMDGQSHELLSSALTNVDKAMKGIIVAQQQAAAACGSTQIESKDIYAGRGATAAISSRDKPLHCTLKRPLQEDAAPPSRADDTPKRPRQEKQAAQPLSPLRKSSAESHRSSDREPPRIAYTAISLPQTPRVSQTQEGAPAAAPGQPKTFQNVDEICAWLSVDAFRQSKDVRNWLDKLTPTPGGQLAGAMVIVNEATVDGASMGSSEDQQSQAVEANLHHLEWACAFERMNLNAPEHMEKDRAIHLMMHGSFREPLPKGDAVGVLPTILRSVTRISRLQQQGGEGDDAKPDVKWTSGEIREHRL